MRGGGRSERERFRFLFRFFCLSSDWMRDDETCGTETVSFSYLHAYTRAKQNGEGVATEMQVFFVVACRGVVARFSALPLGMPSF